MRSLTTGNVKLLLYDSIKDMPIVVARKVQYYAMQEAGIGSTVQDWDSKAAKIVGMLREGMVDEAATELNNIRLTVFSTLEGIDHKSRVFGCMVAVENGKPVRDLSETGIDARMERYSREGLTVDMVEETLDGLKKNLMQSD